MAHRRVVLPSLKVTQRPASGESSVEHILRGLPDLGPQLSHPPGGSSALNSPETENATTVNMLTSCDDVQEPTCYEVESRAAVAGWESVRKGMLAAVTETSAMPIGQVCLHCNATALMRCRQCGPLGYYCSACLLLCHSTVNVFHVAEKWEVIMNCNTQCM